MLRFVNAIDFAGAGRLAAAVGLAILVALLTGCSPGDGLTRGAVNGKITLDKKPLPSGVIRFVPVGETDGPAVMAIITEGAYALPQSEGPVVGNHRVEIEATNMLQFPIDDEAAFAEMAKRGRRMPVNPVPPLYNQSSRLTARIAPEGAIDLNFDLQSKPARSTGR
ncbi:hypothetical protein [Lignipirellula cremea]|uniref:Carboxypeptidase regulatory-like domain-containing protein n=1 Tax=Lignipirellula cremea TaxID=2528010 RepID=A0A518DXB8_9BACT|nr:hypothetical protein [Lignipirellula cremea]QDU96479.1 hypothetical protein Pla8534_43000 [Lignipirellula cremea]